MPHFELSPRLPAGVASWDRLHRPIWIFDPLTCRGLYANAEALELWGADSLEELLSRDFSQLSPAVRSRMEHLAQATATGDTVAERWSFYPNGKPVTVQALISSFALRDDTDALLFEASPVVVGEGELRAVEALRHTSSLISLFDAQGRTTFTNPAAFAAYGDSRHGFSGRFVDADHGAAVFTDVLDGKVLAELQPVQTGDGERFHYLDARRVLDPVTGQPSVLLSERDVTAQVQAERALRSAEERAEVAEAKQRFLANISHELRTPLNSVIGFAGLLAASGLDGDQARHLDRITESGGALLRIINDVIDLSELDGGDVCLDLAPFSPATLVQDALQLMAPAAAAKGLALRLEVAADLPDQLSGDAVRLGTIVSHYLSNAIKFTDHGEIVLRLEASPHGNDAAHIEISVADSGPGLTPSAQARLFRRFSPGDDGLRKTGGGLGLGLAISKALISLMGGEVGVDSVPGKGARFWLRVTLPLPPEAASIEEQDDDRGERPLHILYADDHENNRALVRALLESQGHSCDTVNDGEQAVGAVRSGLYDLVLMDIQMPVLDGIGATRAIRAAGSPHSAVPILALTANTLSEQRDAYAAAGLNDCISKPVKVTDLFSKVCYWGSAAS